MKPQFDSDTDAHPPISPLTLINPASSESKNQTRINCRRNIMFLSLSVSGIGTELVFPLGLEYQKVGSELVHLWTKIKEFEFDISRAVIH